MDEIDLLARNLIAFGPSTKKAVQSSLEKGLITLALRKRQGSGVIRTSFIFHGFQDSNKEGTLLLSLGGKGDYEEHNFKGVYHVSRGNGHIEPESASEL